MTDCQSFIFEVGVGMDRPKPKRAAILEAAIQCFRDNGFAGTTVAQIVQKAGVAQGTFYLYFASKRELVPGIADTIIQEQLRRLNSSPPDTTHSLHHLLETLVDVTFSITDEYRELITFCYSGSAYYHSFSYWESIYQPYYQWVKTQFLSLRGMGEMTLNGDEDYLVNFTVGLLEHGAENYYLFSEESQCLETTKRELLEYLTRALK